MSGWIPDSMLSEVTHDLQKLFVVLGYLCPDRKASAEGTRDSTQDP